MSEPITIRAGDLGPEHIGWRYRGSLIKDVGVVLSTDTGQRWIHPEIEVTLSPPAPIDRLPWETMRDITLTITVDEADARAMVSNWAGSTGNYTSHIAHAIAAALPPAPIRRRITWADLQDVPPRDWDGATVVDGSDHPRLNTIKSWASFFDDDSITTVVIEVPVGHPLAACGEPA